VGIKECSRNSISQAGILFLAYITEFLGFPKGFSVSIDLGHPLVLLSIHSHSGKGPYKLIFCSPLKNRKEEQEKKFLGKNSPRREADDNRLCVCVHMSINLRKRNLTDTPLSQL